jgi:hypothetical protein
VRDDDTPRDELDEEAHRRPQRFELLAGAGSVVAVPAQALERDEDTAVVCLEALRPGDRGRSGELSQHLAIAGAVHVDLVEERGDRLVVATQELQSLERVVVLLLERSVDRAEGS